MTLPPKYLGGVDGRSTWMRRLRDLIGLHTDALGGEKSLSEGEKAIIRKIAVLQVETERLELQFAMNAGSTASELDLYQRTSNSLRRLLEALGLARVVKRRGVRQSR
jgi:hypothetical protein